MCPLAPLGSHASSATKDLSMSFPFLEPQPSQLSRGIRIPTLQMNLEHPAECLAKRQGQGVTPRSAMPPPTPTLSYVLLRLFSVWQDGRICSLLTRAQSNCHLSLSKLGWQQTARGQSPLPTHRSGLPGSCALCPRENSIRGLETQGPCTSEARPRGFGGFMEKSQGQLSQGKCIAIVLIRKGLQPAMVSASCKRQPLTGRPQ